MNNNVLLVALGNSLSGDDGIGEAILNCLQSLPLPSSIRLVDLGTDSLKIMNEYHDESLIVVIDALDMASLEPGEVIVTRIPSLSSSNGRSAHHMDPVQGLRLAAIENPKIAEAEILIVGVQIQSTEIGETLSAKVADAIPYATQVIIDILRQRKIILE